MRKWLTGEVLPPMLFSGILVALTVWALVTMIQVEGLNASAAESRPFYISYGIRGKSWSTYYTDAVSLRLVKVDKVSGVHTFRLQTGETVRMDYANDRFNPHPPLDVTFVAYKVSYPQALPSLPSGYYELPGPTILRVARGEFGKVLAETETVTVLGLNRHFLHVDPAIFGK